MAPFVTVIVPVRNEERFLAETLRPLLSQDYDPNRYEVIVVDGQSTDDTPGVVHRMQAEFPRLQLRSNPKRLSSAARNVGVKHARGEYILIVDGHCEVRSQTYLRDLVDAFDTSGADSLGRPQPLDVVGASPLQRCVALARASRLGHNPGSHIYSDRGGFVKPQSVGIAYRKSVFTKVGLFDERFDACEDVDFNHRVDAAGLTCYFTPKLAIHYHPRDTLRELAWQMQRYGRGRARLLFKHSDTLTLPSMVPAAFLLGVITTFLLGLKAPLFAALFCFIALLYGSVTMLAGVWLALRGKAIELTPLFPAVFLAIHVGAGWGVLSELIAGLWRRSYMRHLTVRPGVLNAMTVDVEDYFHVHAFAKTISPMHWDEYPQRVGDSTRRLLDLLAEREVKATFFVLGWVARRQPRLVAEIVAAGHEVASHGYFHQRIDALLPEEFRADVRLAKRVIENAAGGEIAAYRAPSFSITRQTPWAHEILVEEGFALDSSLAAGRGGRSSDPVGLLPYRIDTKSGPIWEFPLPAARVMGKMVPVAGGGYLRAAPYWFTRRQIRKLNHQGVSVCSYVHPWEIDTRQPRVAAPPLHNVRHRLGLNTTWRKLNQLMDEFSFGTLSQAFEAMKPDILRDTQSIPVRHAA